MALQDAARTTEHVELSIEGMTCASCVRRIEGRLNRLDGVSASVNYATEKASVDYDAQSVAPGQLIAAVEAAKRIGGAVLMEILAVILAISGYIESTAATAV